MTILMNGEKKSVPEGATVQSLLEQFGIHPSTVVVERNELVLPRTRFTETRILEGDKLEIVRFVGGGR